MAPLGSTGEKISGDFAHLGQPAQAAGPGDHTALIKQKVLTAIRGNYVNYVKGRLKEDDAVPSYTAGFVGQWKNLGRFPTNAGAFWSVFMIVLHFGVTDITSDEQFTVTSLEDGNCFGVSNHFIKNVFAQAWQGNLLVRYRYDVATGAILSQSIFAERMEELDAVLGKMLDLEDVQRALETFGIKLRTLNDVNTTEQNLPESHQLANPSKIAKLLQETNLWAARTIEH
ncbi:hypothetical protein M427DRAFT_32950 [Gonapodya prolifera JEL478]|uniref:Uncharacterized protein n=1 Tax=Gonapodya prolifera (strain JEL478) TaxID=1344416 RepID=A0A139AD95_GONPJ|nr:hypothetical protein M427DRAFT_32950 [Gonapodya prolifera JEL478]|eukprot:KXS14747.1 hypothetical protein M427DRAFT_32950 [Gonapodya prolifera JEL478]